MIGRTSSSSSASSSDSIKSVQLNRDSSVASSVRSSGVREKNHQIAASTLNIGSANARQMNLLRKISIDSIKTAVKNTAIGSAGVGGAL